MHFADGSDFALIAGARGKLAGATEHGARVILEEGQARASIKEIPGSAWEIVAGPFSIVTTGAELDMSWSRDDEELRLRAIEGSATVRGPSSPEGARVRAGEEIVTRGREFHVVERASALADEAR
jgi:hypothetical protein